MSRLLGPVLVLAGLAYPFAVYYGMEHLSPRVFALMLGALWLARSLTATPRPGNRWVTLAALLFCLLLGLVNQAEWLRWYPVLMSTLLLGLFGASLFQGMPLVERFARLREPDLPAVAVRYTRSVTAVWSAFFLGNGLVAAALTLWAPLSWWTLYNGLIAYLLMGLLFAGEWLVRQRVRRLA